MLENLIDLLATDSLDYNKIEIYLRELNLPPNSSDILTMTWDEENADGLNVFEIARCKNDVRLFNLLLDFDMPVPMDYNKVGLSKELITLLDSRASWQRIAQDDPDTILFNRTAELIDLGFTRINTEPGEAILAMGITGVGKSVLTNFIDGTDYEKIGDNVKKVNLKSREIAKVGLDTNSETFIPQGYKLASLAPDQLWVDMPGIEDTEGSVREIAAVIGTAILTKQIEKIKSILLVDSWDHIKDPRLVVYREVATKIGHIIDKDPSLKNQLALVVTKAPDGITEIEVRNKLKILWQKELSRIPENYKDKNKLALKHTTEAFITDDLKVLVVDVTNPEHRSKLVKLISDLPEAKSENEFNFTRYHSIVERFKLTLFDFLKHQRTIEDNLINYRTALEENKGKIWIVTNRLQQHLTAANNWKQQKGKLTKGKDIDERIKANDEKIFALKQECIKFTDKMLELKAKKAEIEKSLKSVKLQLRKVANPESQGSESMNQFASALKAQGEIFSHSYNRLLSLYNENIGALDQAQKENENQRNYKQRLKKELHQEKIDLREIETRAGDNIDDLIQQEESLAQSAQAELDLLRTQQQEFESLFSENEMVLNINQEFFAKLHRLVDKLSWREQLNQYFSQHPIVMNNSAEINETTVEQIAQTMPRYYSTRGRTSPTLFQPVPDNVNQPSANSDEINATQRRYNTMS